MKDLPRLVAAFVLGSLKPEELSNVANEQLNLGLDSPSLRRLAGATVSEYNSYELSKLFEDALSELGEDLPSKEQAAIIIRNWYLKEIVAGNLRPFEGVDALIKEAFIPSGGFGSTKTYVGDSMGIAKLYGLADQYWEISERTSPFIIGRKNQDLLEEIEKAIVEEVKILLSAA